jgi:hypothetical protein
MDGRKEAGKTRGFISISQAPNSRLVYKSSWRMYDMISGAGGGGKNYKKLNFITYIYK